MPVSIGMSSAPCRHHCLGRLTDNRHEPLRYVAAGDGSAMTARQEEGDFLLEECDSEAGLKLHFNGAFAGPLLLGGLNF
jgi:hypothetical protein